MPGRDTDPKSKLNSVAVNDATTPSTHAAPQSSRHGQHRALVRDALRAMSIRERVVVCLRYADGLSLEEIAAVLEAGTSEIERVLEQAVARVRSLVARSTAQA
ncbi:MAG: sigma factor-like helix-turn-helix DNA-binding protein [Phycisphaerales bacterium]